MLITLVTILHVLVCLFLVFVVLIQSGKSADVAAAFGGMGSQTAFGPRGAATVLTKATTWAAILFMLTSITLSIAMSHKRSGSILSGATPSKKTQPPPPAKGSNQEPQPVTR